MDQRPVGVFDSGLGGLTAVRELRRLLPSENIICFGDTARVPYGNRSRETLLKYARQDIHFLRSFDLKALVIACGTVSTTALEMLQEENDIPVIGVVEPACRRAAALTRNRRVGLIATMASISSGAYELPHGCVTVSVPFSGEIAVAGEEGTLEELNCAELNPVVDLIATAVKVSSDKAAKAKK